MVRFNCEAPSQLKINPLKIAIRSTREHTATSLNHPRLCSHSIKLDSCLHAITSSHSVQNPRIKMLPRSMAKRITARAKTTIEVPADKERKRGKGTRAEGSWNLFGSTFGREICQTILILRGTLTSSVPSKVQRNLKRQQDKPVSASYGDRRRAGVWPRV